MKVVLIAAALLLCVLIIGLHSIPQADEPLTELSFDNHTSLPEKIAAGTPTMESTSDPRSFAVTEHPNLVFSFAVHNLEGKQWNYTYTISIINETNTTYTTDEFGDSVPGNATIEQGELLVRDSFTLE